MTNVIDFEDDRPARLIVMTDDMAQLALLPRSAQTGDRMCTLADEVRSLVDSIYR